MGFDQFPIHGIPSKQAVDVSVRPGRRRTEPFQVFPVANARHELDAEQIRQPVHRRTLRLGVAMQRVGPNVGSVLGQAVEDVHGLPNAAGDEMREQRNVVVTDVIVGNAAIIPFAIIFYYNDRLANMMRYLYHEPNTSS